jgi:uncharacterized protein (DUF433 family)
MKEAADKSRVTVNVTSGELSEEDHMDWRERIAADPNILVGKPIIKGTRIAVEFVIDLLARGWTVEQILKEYDHLTREDIQACLAYARELVNEEKVYSVPA